MSPPDHNKSVAGDFKSPPVQEVLLGVQFRPVEWLGPFDIGALLSSLVESDGDSWHKPRVRMATGQMSLDGSRSWVAPLEVGPGLRGTLLRADGARLLQLENGWLTTSWIRRDGGEEYPHFNALRDQLATLLKRLEQAVAELRPDSPSDSGSVVTPNFWEFTYVNEIPSEIPPMQWHDWFPGLVGPLPHLDGAAASACSMVTSARFESFDGQVESKLEPRERRDGDETRVSLALRITAQGELGQSIREWHEGIEAGHRAAFNTFVSLLSAMAKKEFGYVAS